MLQSWRGFAEAHQDSAHHQPLYIQICQCQCQLQRGGTVGGEQQRTQGEEGRPFDAPEQGW